MKYRRSPIENESPELLGYDTIKYNLSESSITDLRLGDLGGLPNDLVLMYGNHYGKPELRALIASESPNLSSGDVLLTPGAAAALFMLHTVLLEAGDHIVVAYPNYATNLETPRMLGAQVDMLPLRFENQFQPDFAELERLMTPHTKLISLTTPHNPTGSRLSLGQLRDVIALSERTGCHVLLDETYRDMVVGDELPLGASLHPRVISISSMSKSYGLPGIRVGWVICQDAALMEGLLAAKEQILISGSMIDEELCHRALLQRATRLPTIRARLTAQLAVVRSWIATEPRMEWVEPRGGCVCFPRIKTGVNVNINVFYDALLSEFGTYVGAGHWFEMDRRYMRIGYGWPTPEALVAGLLGISHALDVAVN